jgi:hypothetical protein
MLFTLCAVTALAQTSSFTYQGRLTDGGTAANGNYDLQFALFDSGGAQVGTTQTSSNVLVSAGIFTVSLDFGAGAFSGAPRFLEISARLTGAGSFTTLAPRQQITSTPYAIRSLNASSADTVTVSGVPSGSGNYIQNATTQQASANFNISGNGTAGGTLSAETVNAATQYNIGGNRVFSVGGLSNTFAGINAGIGNTGNSNSFFGAGAGVLNTFGQFNSFFGASVGRFNTEGGSNAFFGTSAGFSNVKGGQNAFFGFLAGSSNSDGSNNTAIGGSANVGSNNLTNATALGAKAQVDQSDSLVLGSVAGFNGATTSVKVGIGTTAPTQKLAVETTSAGAQTLVTLNVPNTVGNNGALDFAVNNAGTIIPVVKVAAIYGAVNDIGLAFSTFNASGMAERVRIDKSGNVGIGTTAPSAKFTVRGAGGPGGSNILRVENSGGQDALLVSEDRTVAIGLLSSSASAIHVCIDFLNRLSQCSSSLRFKENVTPFSSGLELIRQLRPIRFTWKNNGTPDLGLGAEDVAKVEPLLVTHNDKGEIQGVKYDQLNVVLINAIKQQQEQIETLRTANVALNTRLRAVEKIVRKRVGASRRRH